jgi:hypothetical protein
LASSVISWIGGDSGLHQIIEQDRIIIDGYDLWELAKEAKRPILHCIEYDLSETLLQRHRRSKGLP